MLKIFIINALSDNYIYLLRNEHKNITSVIDPGEAEPVIKFLNDKKWHLDEVINTHHHHDHVGGNRELLDIYKSKLIAPSYEKDRISNIDILVSDNETVNVTGISTELGSTEESEAACADAGAEFVCEFFDCSDQEACGVESYVTFSAQDKLPISGCACCRRPTAT